jgi:hypothetical protein
VKKRSRTFNQGEDDKERDVIFEMKAGRVASRAGHLKTILSAS